jgi:hypothetical protein
LEAAVGERQLTEEKHRAAIRLDAADVATGRTQAGAGLIVSFVPRHSGSIQPLVENCSFTALVTEHKLWNLRRKRIARPLLRAVGIFAFDD